MAKKLIGGGETPKKKPGVNYTAAGGGLYGSRGVGNKPVAGNYSGNAAPRVGGVSVKASGLKGGSKSHVKAGKSMVRKGTGSGASKQARRSY